MTDEKKEAEKKEVEKKETWGPDFNGVVHAVPEKFSAEPVAPTPSMDDKHIPSPPVRTVEEYHADCQLGITRIGKPQDKKG